jgi:excisionase family DNA binding protein
MRKKMQLNAGLSLLTTAEAASYLRLKERKLYELIADRQIPCTKVTGKWLFSRADLDRWLLSGMVHPAGMLPPEPPPIVGGSHDPLLQWALSESRAGLAILPEGSEIGYQRFIKGELVAAAIHLHDLDEPTRDANPEAVAAEPSLRDAVLIGFAAREQGLVVAAGNPLGIASLGEAHARNLRAALRPPGAGAQQLLEGLLRRERIAIDDLSNTLVAPTGPDVAQAIRAGNADFGVATRAVATAAGLGFVPLCVERFDLLMRQRDYFRPPLQTLLALFREPRFSARAAELGGLDVSAAGRVRWAP